MTSDWQPKKPVGRNLNRQRGRPTAKWCRLAERRQSREATTQCWREIVGEVPRCLVTGQWASLQPYIITPSLYVTVWYIRPMELIGLLHCFTNGEAPRTVPAGAHHSLLSSWILKPQYFIFLWLPGHTHWSTSREMKLLSPV